MTDREAEGRRDAGKAIRDLGHALVGHRTDAESIDALVATLRALTAHLEANPVRTRIVDEPAGGPPPADPEMPLDAYDDRPFSGLASPWGLDFTVHRTGEASVEAELTLRSAHEGAPGRSHGGIVAGLFDDVFGFVLGTLTLPAFTGELSIRYERPTPLHRPIVCRGRLDHMEGRKVWIAGELIDVTEPDQPVIARATGLFITVDREVWRARTQELPAPVD